MHCSEQKLCACQFTKDNYQEIVKTFTRLLHTAAQVTAFYRFVDLAIYAVLECCDYGGHMTHILLPLLSKAKVIDNGEAFLQ